MKAFLQSPGVDDATNAAALKITNFNDPASWEGVQVENGRIVSIDWKGKRLAGNLDLSGFKALVKVDVSGNRLSGLTLASCPVLADVNASRNRLTEFSVSACPALASLNLYRNRLMDISLSDTPALKYLNVAANYFVLQQWSRLITV